MQLLVRAWLLGSEEGTLGVLPLISPTHLGWDFKGEEVETPGGQGLQRGKNRASAANGSFLGFSPLALCQPPQPMCTPCQLAFCSESPCFSLMPYPRFLDIQLVQPPPPTGYVFSALLHLCLLCLPGSLPLPAQVPLIPPPLPQSRPSPVLGPRISWALSPASRDVVGAQPLGSGTSGCCLQVGSRLLRAPLTLAAPTYPRPSRGRVREEETESERDEEEQELRPFLLG